MENTHGLVQLTPGLKYSRRLLLVDPCQECRILIPRMEANGWSITTCELAEVPDQGFDVGLIRLHDAHLKRAEPLKALLGRAGTEWLAAVRPESMQCPSFSNFVGEWFFDYHTLPFEPERVCVALGRAYGMARLRKRPTPINAGYQIIGDSKLTRQLNGLIGKLAPTDSPVLIRGDSGTGKELVARALHWRSRRASGPFVPVNCGAIAEHLIQSEMFGHEKGAFTGAHQRKIGRIEQANGGTLFLDEIGDLPLELQANLLRFLQEKQIERVGSSKPINVDVRVLAATHIDLEQAIEQGRFREDLYYRLNVLQVQTARLNERREDIPPLAHHFAELYAIEVGRRPRRFSEDAMQAMIDYDWPGNVRELANRVRRGMALAEGRLIQAFDLGLEQAPSHRSRIDTLNDYILRAEAHALSDALSLFPNNASRAAAALGVSRPTFYRLLHKHHLR